MKKQLEENGLTPRVHGLTRKRSYHGLPYEVIEGTVLFIKRNADEFGFHCQQHQEVVIIHHLYYCLVMTAKLQFMLGTKSCVEADKEYVGATVFYEVWNSCVPHIEFIKPKTDLCKTCSELQKDIAGAVNKCNKLELTQKLVAQLEVP